MPVDSGGSVSRPAGQIPVTGQGADAPQVNQPMDDIYSILNLLAFLDGRKAMKGNIALNGYKATGAANATDPGDYVTLSQVQGLIAAVQGVPTGSILPMTGAVIPAGYVVGNGQSLLRATYPTFWAWVQTSGNLAATEGAKTIGQYGPGDGSTTFTVPNLYADGGYFIRPMGSGRTIGSVQADELKTHTHTGLANSGGIHRHAYNDYTSQDPGQLTGGGAFAGAYAVVRVTEYDGAHSHALTIDSAGGTETRPKNVAYPVLIKT